MIFSLALILRHLSSNLMTEQNEMESTTMDADQSKPKSTLDITIIPSKSGRFPAFIRDKLAYFKMGSTLSIYRRHLHEAEAKVITLAEQCKSLRQEVELSTARREEMAKAWEAKLADMNAAHTAQVTAIKDSRNILQENMDSILKDHITLNDAKKKIAKQMKTAEARLKLQDNIKGALGGKLHLAEQKHIDLQKRLKALEAKYAEMEAKYKEQEVIFDAKYKEQQVMFDTKCKQQKSTGDAAYKSQSDWFHTKCSEQKAMFDKKVRQQEATFTAKLQNEMRKCEELERQKEALTKRLGNTETVLLKSRQVKVNQEYEFTDAVNSLVPRQELLAKQEECQLYKKIMSVFAALILVLMSVVFVGIRFLFY